MHGKADNELAGRGIPRFAEFIVALVGIVLCLPLIAICAVAVAVSSPGPVLFRQRRVGRGGKFFVLYKMRTMSVAQNSGGSPQVTAGDDKRITAVGKVLRKTKIDELPELWNVLKGDMSLVGPRPEVPGYVDVSNPMWQRVLQARPGITDPMTLRLRNEEALLEQVTGDREEFYLRTLQPFKLQGYAEYLSRRTPWSDIAVLWNTFIAIVRPSKAPPPTLSQIAGG